LCDAQELSVKGTRRQIITKIRGVDPEDSDEVEKKSGITAKHEEEEEEQTEDIKVEKTGEPLSKKRKTE
jgi:hypothetical protein